jgi:thioredoxin 1
MKKTVLAFSILALLSSSYHPLVAEETKETVVSVQEVDVNEDIKVILEFSFLSENARPFLLMVASQAMQESGKEMNEETLLVQFSDLLTSPEVIDRLAKPFLSLFSVEEIKNLRKIYENPVFEKYTREGLSIFQSNIAIIEETLKELVKKYGTVAKAEDQVKVNIIEVTKENFEEIVTKAQKPLIIDVYSTSCGPCKMMEPILKELSFQHKESVQFLKINCDTQPELATKYHITQLPTLLFVKPGEEAVTLKTTGFTSKKDLNEKIVKFVQ